MLGPICTPALPRLPSSPSGLSAPPRPLLQAAFPVLPPQRSRFGPSLCPPPTLDPLLLPSSAIRDTSLVCFRGTLALWAPQGRQALWVLQANRKAWSSWPQEVSLAQW